MTIRELKAILETMDENKDVFVFNWETKSMDDIDNASDNNGHLQLNVCYSESMSKEEYMNYICPIIREQLEYYRDSDVSSSEIDDIANDLLREIDLSHIDVDKIFELLDKYLETYPVED